MTAPEKDPNEQQSPGDVGQESSQSQSQRDDDDKTSSPADRTKEGDK